MRRDENATQGTRDLVIKGLNVDVRKLDRISTNKGREGDTVHFANYV